MSFPKTLWGLLFRLFPCPTDLGLRRIGNPGPESPVLVTCNFDLTVNRLTRALCGVDAWLLVAQSKGVNVWCAAGAGEFDTASVVSILKTSEIAEQVGHRRLVLPPLGAPGICAGDVERQTGWSVRWGPVRATDLRRYIKRGCQRDDAMKRTTYGWQERLDTGLGSLFLFYFIGAVGFALFGRSLLPDYLAVGAACFAAFMLLCPWLPGRRGITKVLFLDLLFGFALVAAGLLPDGGAQQVRTDLLIAMIALLFFGSELGGLSSTMRSDLDPLLARLGIGAVGNAAFAGTVRTDLLNGVRALTYDREACVACHSCIEVCPQGVWAIGEDGRAEFARPGACTACRACLVQCRAEAIRAIVKAK